MGSHYRRTKIGVVNTYISPSLKVGEQKAIVLDVVNKVKSLIKTGYEVILTGDFN